MAVDIFTPNGKRSRCDLFYGARYCIHQRSIERQMDDVYSSPTAVSAQEDWLADVAVYPAGETRALVQARSTGATSLLHATYAELLAQCREFKTLDEHLYAFYQRKQLNGTQMSAEVVQGLRCKLQQLARSGYLIPRSHIHGLFEEADASVPPSRITSLGIPTCDRVDTLQGSITSYLENCQRFGRSLEFIVVDDSSSPATRDAYRQMLRGLRERYGMSIAYAGLEEKTAYARKLSEAGQIPAEVVSGACVGNRTYGVSTLGANRNALLLHTVGECLFSSDDDIICRVAASPGFREELVLRSQRNPAQYWFYSDRESALKAVPPVEQDFLALHEQWLGQDPRVSGVSYSRTGQLSVERAEPGFLRRFAMQPGKIALTMNGIVGDACFRTTDFLFFTSAESLKRLVSSEGVYHSARTSREIAQVVSQLTLTPNPDPLLGACMGGMDNRELLPPFPPVGPIEDYAFGLMLSRCFPDIYAVYLPWALLHAPLEARAYADPIFNAGGYITRNVPFYGWLPRCIALFHPDRIGTPIDYLSQLGQFLERIGQLPASTFEEFTHHLLLQDDGRLISSLELSLHNDELLTSYRQDVEAYCTRARQTMMLPIKQRLQGGAELAQRSIVQFAQILQWWPAMIETARCLRAEGCRVARPV